VQENNIKVVEVCNITEGVVEWKEEVVSMVERASKGI